MKNQIALLASLAVAACAELPVEHVLGTEGVPADQLAVIDIWTNEVQLLEIDGKREVPNTTPRFYIHPGMHRLVFAYHYEDCVAIYDYEDGVSYCLPDTKTSPISRDACVRAEPGMVYSFRAPGVSLSEALRRGWSEWKLYVSKRGVTEGSREQEIDATCPQ